MEKTNNDIIPISTRYSVSDILFVILDKSGKVWSITADAENETLVSNCLNDNLTSLNSVQFSKIGISHAYSAEGAFEFSAGIDRGYQTILGIDNDNNLWEIVYRDYDDETGTQLASYVFKEKNISETKSIGTVKDLTIAGPLGAVIIDSNGKLYEYYFTSRNITDCQLDISVKQYKAARFIDVDGNIYSSGGTLINEEYGNMKIKEIYDYGYVLDVNGNIWESGWYTNGNFVFENLENVNFLKVSTNYNVFAAIDSENNLLLNNIIDK